MKRRALKYHVAAALFSAAFLFGVSPADAYTYSGGTLTVDQVAEDENDLVVTGGANVINNGMLNPQKKQETVVTKTITTQTLGWSGGLPQAFGGGAIITGLPQNISSTIVNEIIQAYKKVAKLTNIAYNKTTGTYYPEYDRPNNAELDFKTINNKYGYNIRVSRGYSSPSNIDPIVSASIVREFMGSTYFCYELKYNNGTWTFDTSKVDKDVVTSSTPWEGIDLTNGSPNPKVWENGGNSAKTTNETLKLKETKNLGDAAINITNKSILTSKDHVQTSKAINVTGTSKLTTATGSITGGTITSDGDIIAQSNYSAPSGKSTIAGATITASGALTASKDIKATTGSISGSVIQATSGNIVANNTIKATGKVKGNALNVGVINASSASITGNQSISGVFTTTGQAKLDGGAKLSNKKITGLSAGTLSATSTEAVNGAQLNTIKQKLASAGKSYTAGSDIAISSANAISVSKTGAVKFGNTGIVTGGTVYTETNNLNTKLNGLKDLVNSHQTTISSLQKQMGDLNQTISDINSNVASATSNLSNQLKNCLKSDMGNLSAAGRTAIKNIVSDSLKSMGRQSSQTLTSPIATFAEPDVKDIVNAKDVESVHTALVDKVGKSALSDITATVDANTKQISSNADNIHSNASSIESLKSGKSDVSGSNIDTDAYASKLGTGSVAKGENNLISGDTVYGALDKKADISYVDSGIGMMENQMEGIRQQATHDINRVGAGASALAALHPTAYDASDKISFASGYGHYKNANSSALGAFYHPNEKTMVSVAGTIGNNDAMLSAGVSIKVGMSDHVDKVMVTPKMFSAQQVNNEQIQHRVDGQRDRLDEIERTLSAIMR